jgi:hypothetical protein
MDEQYRGMIWRQFGASVDTLENAIRNCPDEIWGNRAGYHEYWYMVYHTLFWLDYDVSGSPDEYIPPPPFTLGELDPAGVLPDRVYTKQEMLNFLEIGKEHARRLIAALPDEPEDKPYQVNRLKMSSAELLLYTMRHLQHHAAQLNLLLRQKCDFGSRWVARSKTPLRDS